MGVVITAATAAADRRPKKHYKTLWSRRELSFSLGKVAVIITAAAAAAAAGRANKPD